VHRETGYDCAIVRSKHVGRRRPVAALIATVVLFASGCSGSDGPPQPEPEDAARVGADSVGRCLRFDESLDAVVDQLPFIDCSEPHTHQIYAVKEYDENDVYPGFGKLEDDARLVCLGEFEAFVGRSAFESTLFYSWLVPTLEGWNDNVIKDRTTLCVLGSGDSTTLTESMRGANV
jgi:hypothetical protein